MSFTNIEKTNYDHLKKMQVGDIWIDIYGDYFLVTEVYKSNVRSKTKKFWINFSAILLTADHQFDGPQSYPGQFIDDFNPSIVKEKIA